MANVVTGTTVDVLAEAGTGDTTSATDTVSAPSAAPRVFRTIRELARTRPPLSQSAAVRLRTPPRDADSSVPDVEFKIAGGQRWRPRRPTLPPTGAGGTLRKSVRRRLCELLQSSRAAGGGGKQARDSNSQTPSCARSGSNVSV